MDTSLIQADFERHRTSPEVSVDEYVRRRSIELGGWVIARERVYLDKCFWIRLRDARIGRTEDPTSHALLCCLVRTVREGRRVCPISDALFLELLKQSDLQTRTATAELIDELSCGVTLVHHPTRVATEIAHFLHANSGKPVHTLETLVWSKLTNVLGVHHPIAEAFPAEEQAVIQKAFFDQMWRLSLAEMITVIGEATIPESPYPTIAERLNRGNAAHADQMMNFSQVYLDEVHGCLELVAPIAYEVLGKMAAEQSGFRARELEEEREGATQDILGFLRTAITKPPVRRALRTLHIGALLHAAVRWNRTQIIDANDLYDFHHAEAALGYCDFFLTDKPMHALLTQGHLAIQEDFPCRITSSREEAATWLQ